MSATEEPVLGGVDALRAAGFEGFATVVALREAAAEGVPAETGVWVVVRDIEAPPRFMPKSWAATWRGMDPTEPADALAARWVAGAAVLYVGTAPGSGVRARLQQRIKRFLRFGAGRNVGHWSGRRIWQLSGNAGLRIGWKCVAEGGVDAEAARMLAAFESRHGALPFANDPGEDEE